MAQNSGCYKVTFSENILLNQAHAWFLEIAFVYTSICVCLSICLCVSAFAGINNQWCDIDRVWYGVI